MKVLLGVSASVAIYKAAELCRELRREGADVTVVMTPNATKLIEPRLFDAVTERKTLTDLFDRTDPFAHITAARGADVFAVAPATANVLGKLAGGIADDAVTTVALSVDCPRLVAPAMNPFMWAKAEVQRSLSTLREFDYTVVPPGEGKVACGDEGPGRLAEVAEIAEEILRSGNTGKDFAGKTIVVTAGPTREPFDAVRVLTNPSTGLMGYELARRAGRRGADVVLITGTAGDPVHPGAGTAVRRVNTAAEMRDATAAAFAEADALIMAAAVSDYRFDETSAHKVKKTSEKESVALIPTSDILAEIAGNKGDKVVVGFAAETGDLIENARDKLLKKKLDIIVGNVVGRPDVGFAVGDAEAVIITAEDATDVGKIPKAELAERVLDELSRAMEAGRGK
ncbi:MAG: bifunctional phosphopantothenoylcysteine decarboxylase/phosphopantothenate--cysteine ligase CoaBC [Candidatus Zixiibacteriota bacterium]|jgi:phosphopantothenoylcysteine decarboxylase/phosphopantothenate--cysteine ligase